MDNQNEQVFQYLLHGNVITNADALNRLHIGRLAARISELKNDYCVPITTTMVPNTHNNGHHAVYSMPKEARDMFEGATLHDVHNILAKKSGADNQ
jgi:hypothetical protein